MMSRWYEVRQEVRSTGRGQATFVSRYSAAHFASDPRPGPPPPGLRVPGAVQGGRPIRMYLAGGAQERRAPSGPPPPEALRAAGSGRLEPRQEPGRNGTPRQEPPRPMPYGTPRGIVYEKGYADPGCYVRVPFGPFEAELAPQMQAPEALAPAHLVDCLVQVYRIHRPLPLDLLALAEANDPELAGRFQVLTGAKARLLGLNVRPEEEPPAQPGRPAPRVARPGQHLWSMTLLFDPTREAASGPPPEQETDPI